MAILQKPPAIRWLLLAKTWKTWPPACHVSAPFFLSNSEQHANHQTKCGGGHSLKPCYYCSKFNIFQHWRLVINQITPTHLWNAFASLVHWFIHFLSAMSGLSSVSNSYTSPPRSLWDSFMARRLEDSQRWELPLTQSQLNKGYPCCIKVHICHLDISWTLHQFQWVLWLARSVFIGALGTLHIDICGWAPSTLVNAFHHGLEHSQGVFQNEENPPKKKDGNDSSGTVVAVQQRWRQQ